MWEPAFVSDGGCFGDVTSPEFHKSAFVDGQPFRRSRSQDLVSHLSIAAKIGLKFPTESRMHSSDADWILAGFHLKVRCRKTGRHTDTRTK